MTSWRSVTLTEKVVTQLYKTNPTWSKRHVQSLLPKCSVIHSTKFYSTHIVKSPYKDCDIPEVTLNEYLFSRFEKFADYPAVECGVIGRTYTYWQLQQLSKKFAVSLLKAGLKPGQVLSIVLTNCPEFIVAVLGGLEAGLVVSPCNHSYTPAELSHLLSNSGAACVVTSPDKVSTVLAAKAHIEESKKIKFPLKIVAIDRKSETLAQGVGRYSELVGNHVDITQLDSLKNYLMDNQDVAIMPFSSGTTGLAKGVKLSHRNIVSNIIQKDEPAINNHIDASQNYQEVVAGILPFFHIIGLIVIVMHSLCHGSKIVTLPKFDKTQFGSFLKTHRCTILYLVPPLALFIGTHESVTTQHLASLHAIISGAAPLGVGDIEKCKSKLKPGQQCTFIQGYGMTETGTIAMNSFTNTIDPGTVGRIVSRTIARVVDCSTGQPVGPLNKGEICIKGPQVMIGYHNNPEATADAIDEEGWFHTGDIGYCDENGYFYIVDRVKELIKVKGFQVPPAELEELLRQHPAVSDAGVIGVPDSRSGEVPVAYVVRSAHKETTAEELKQYIADNVSTYKRLADVVFVEAIPKTVSGKILRKEIKKLYVKPMT